MKNFYMLRNATIHRLFVTGLVTLLAQLGLIPAGAAQPALDFDTDIIPVLTKAGCNAGACHGAAAGRGEFRLSLYGGDPAADFEAIALELEGRRVNLARPGESLVLLKATETIVHGGGYRLDPDQAGAARLQQWIAEGAVRQQSRQLSHVRVSPAEQLVERAGTTVPLAASATFADGTEIDVTRWTVFTAQDPAAVAVDAETATATVLRRGRHVIVARYLDRVIPLVLTVPLADTPVDLADQVRRNFVDDHILDTLGTLRLPVSPRTTDAAFLRRVALDLTGRLPTTDTHRAFLEDARPDKRDALIESLLASSAFNDYWTWRFAQLLRIRSQPQDTQGAQTYYNWLKQRLSSDTPYNEIVHEMLTSSGDTHAIGPANFYRTADGPREQAEFVSELLMGSRLRCANCHNHPLDRWTQDDYHGLAAIFAAIRRGRVIEIGIGGEVAHPRTGDAAVPRIPGDRFLDARQDGRDALAAWLTDPGNPYFAKALVNRLWKFMMGRGLVEPTDDLRDTNPASHPALLSELAADFVSHGYSLRHTLRRIARSAAYQRSASQLPENSADDRYYSHALARPLPPEVLLDAISDVTGVAEPYADQPLGTRAVELFDGRINSASLDVLGRCSREESCESGAATTDGLTRMLHLYNGPLLNRPIAHPTGRLSQLVAAGQPTQDIVEQFYLRALGRSPTVAEAAYWHSQFDVLDEPRERHERLEDFLWGLLTCQEFVTNH